MFSKLILPLSLKPEAGCMPDKPEAKGLLGNTYSLLITKAVFSP